MSTTPPTDSLGKRYLFKLSSNTATIPLFLVLEAVLPRALGPALYGNYSFATTLFLNTTTFLDMGTSTCLTTALAKRPEEPALFSFYLRIAAVVLFLCLAAGALMQVPTLGEVFLPGVPLWMALPAALWAYITWAGRVTRSMNDALGLTTRSEILRIGINALSAAALLGLFFLGVLNLPVLFAHQYVFLGMAALAFCLPLRPYFPIPKMGRSRLALQPEQFRSYAGEFRQYSAPLFISTLFTVLFLSGERWMLQFFGGSSEQGYFSLSYKVGLACFLFVGSMTPLITRELAVAHGKRDPAKMAQLLDRYAPMLYAVACVMACFAVVEAAGVVRLFGGAAFAGAILPVQIMALFPIHQTYGQIASSIFYATGQTRLLRNLSLWSLALGAAAAWLLLAPAHLGGFGLGATGLAVKMVAVQFVAVNIFLFAGRRSAPFNYRRNLIHQLLCPVSLLFVALLCREGTQAIGFVAPDSLLRFFVSGAVYLVLLTPLVALVPALFGLTRQDVQAALARLRGK